MKNYCFTCMNEIDQSGFCKNCMKQSSADTFVHHLAPGTILNNKYLVGNCLGEGGFGITYIGRDLTLDIKVAIKEFYPNGYVNRNNQATQMVTATTQTQSAFFNKGKQRFLQEARNVAKFIGEPGIVGVREYFECNNTAYIIMEYLDGENLNASIKKNGVFKPEAIFNMMLPIVRSLQKIHDTGMIHRDISPDNIMFLKNGTLMLMDFGSARFFTNDEKEMSVMLKQGYAPEEQYRKNGDQGPWTDVYGLCATLYKCVTGVSPVDALDRMRVDELKKPSELGVSIPQPLEVVMMYGLAVFKENRCHDMRELEDLMQKALGRQELSVSAGPDVRDDLYRTHASDDQYKTQIAEGFETMGYGQPPVPPVQNSGYAQSPGAGYTPPQQPYDPQRQKQDKGPSNKAVLTIVITSVVLILAVAGLLLYLLWPNKDKNVDKVKRDDTTVVSDAGDDNDNDADIDVAGSPTSAPMVTVPQCVNKKLSSAEQELADLGLSVKVEYAFSSSVTKDFVISQDIAQGMQVDPGEIVTLTVSKGPEKKENPNNYSQKLVVSASSGSSYGTAVLYEWSDSGWKSVANYSCSLGRNGIGPGREGSSYTPQGIHKLGVVLSAYSVSTSMNTYTANSNTCVVDDVNSSLYNQIMNKNNVPSGVSYDTIGKGLTDGTTYATIYIEHNGSGFSSAGVVKGGGSAIGLRGQYGSLSPTYGDVDISASNMTDLLRRLDPSKNPMIEIKVN